MESVAAVTRDVMLGTRGTCVIKVSEYLLYISFLVYQDMAMTQYMGEHCYTGKLVFIFLKINNSTYK